MCECIADTNKAFAEMGDPTRVDTVWWASEWRTVVRAYVEGDDKSPARGRRLSRRPTTLIAVFCPFCGEQYGSEAGQ